MTIYELESLPPRLAIPYSRMTPDGKKIDAESSSRKLFDKKATKKAIGSLRIWLGQRADGRYVCWHPMEQKIVLISECLMPRLNDDSVLKEGSVDVTEIKGVDYFLDERTHKTVEFGWQDRLAELYREYTE